MDLSTEPTPQPAVAPKAWWESKTIWFNAALAALGAAEAGLGLLQPVLGEHAYPLLAFGLAVGNAALRVITRQPLAWGQA